MTRRPGPGSTRSPPVTVEVERLILDVPVSMATGRIIGEAVESELARLIAEQGLPAIDVERAAAPVEGGAMEWRPEHGNQAFARNLAQAVHTALGGSQGREQARILR